MVAIPTTTTKARFCESDGERRKGGEDLRRPLDLSDPDGSVPRRAIRTRTPTKDQGSDEDETKADNKTLGISRKHRAREAAYCSRHPSGGMAARGRGHVVPELKREKEQGRGRGRGRGERGGRGAKRGRPVTGNANPGRRRIEEQEEAFFSRRKSLSPRSRMSPGPTRMSSESTWLRRFPLCSRCPRRPRSWTRSSSGLRLRH